MIISLYVSFFIQIKNIFLLAKDSNIKLLIILKSRITIS